MHKCKWIFYAPIEGVIALINAEIKIMHTHGERHKIHKHEGRHSTHTW